MARKLGNWIDSFMEWTEGLPSTEIYREWAGVMTISAALQRRVKCRIVRKDQFPNIFALLVGTPGTGKSVAINAGKDLIRPIQTIHLSPASMTRRSFISRMEETKDQIVNELTGGKLELQCALSAFIDEFGTFVKEGDLDFMEVLADLYDNPITWEHRTEHSGSNSLENATLTMVGCTQPRYIGQAFSQQALEMGFPARCILVFSDESVRHGDLFTEHKDRSKLELELVHDLQEIHNMQGTFTWTQEAASSLQAWYDSGMMPLPPDSRFQHYNTRRLAHITKLTMIFAAAKSSDLSLTEADLKAAKEFLLKTESRMGEAMSMAGANPLHNNLKLLIVELKRVWNKNPKGSVKESVIRKALEQEVPFQYVDYVIEALHLNGHAQVFGERPNRVFKAPGA